MVMALGGEKKRFHISLQPSDQILERLCHRSAGKFVLLTEDPLSVIKIVRVAVTLKDEIEAMDGNSLRGEEFRDCLEVGRDGRRWNMLEH